MKLARLMMVNRIAETRRLLLEQIAVVEKQPDPAALRLLKAPFRIVIGEQVQDHAMTAIVRPIVLGELRGRVRSLDRDRAALGVEVE